MIFASDNWAGAHPAVSDHLAANSGGYATAYGNSEVDARVAKTFCDIFEREVGVYFVSTGTAANSLSMTALARPAGVAFAHAEAHMIADEGGAPEYLAGGLRLCPVDGALGRMDPTMLEEAIGRYPAAFLHSGQPAAVSITQATEIGTVHSLDDIDTIAGIARRHGLPLHMDGARFANALVALDTTPAEMTWKRGVDIVSFGATKNGCWCAEAIVVMEPDKHEALPFLRKRAAQLFSKSRFVALQFEAYFRDDLWLSTARHSNAMAARLAEAFRASNAVRLAWEPQANEVFAIMSRERAENFRRRGAIFHPWATPRGYEGVGADETICRFVTSFATTVEDVDGFTRLLAS
ncbi:MAG: low specificity L-threonine aldolase [Rhizobiaceae bacterium]|nr:low specificity L-threonine aldolase [Rhizobiaceae bacterium]MCV0406915.1 low specificity L-threonine aldolase [Rhizobiaceae bacterium]